MLRTVFGAKAQLLVGAATFLAGVLVWAYFEAIRSPNVRDVFRISMFFGLVACYAIIATALGFRATERVEAKVVENIEHADEVDVG